MPKQLQGSGQKEACIHCFWCNKKRYIQMQELAFSTSGMRYLEGWDGEWESGERGWPSQQARRSMSQTTAATIYSVLGPSKQGSSREGAGWLCRRCWWLLPCGRCAASS